MKNKVSTSIAFIVLFSLSACSMKRVEFSQQYNLNWVQKAAIIDFEDLSAGSVGSVGSGGRGGDGEAQSNQSRPALGAMVPDIFAKHLLGSGFDIIERKSLQRILDEKHLELSGVINDEQISTIGTLSGVDAIITGTVLVLPKGKKQRVALTSRMVDTDTGELIWAASDTRLSDDVFSAIDSILSDTAKQLVCSNTGNIDRKQIRARGAGSVPEDAEDDRNRTRTRTAKPDPAPQLNNQDAILAPETANSGNLAPETDQKGGIFAPQSAKVTPKPDPGSAVVTPKTASGAKKAKAYKPRKSAKMILAIMKENPNVTVKELALQLGIKERAIKYNIKNLKANGFLKRIGASKNGHWEVLE